MTERVRRAPLLALALAASASAQEALPPVTVTATGEPRPLASLAGNAAVIGGETIAEVGHTHASELLYRAPGAWISRGTGQEHLTAIRSPVLTGAGACGGFLLLEDGIPVRPAGFCNVNGLFELNTEQAAAIEVVRGPGSALYGSNALHGAINVLSPPVSAGGPAFTAEGGSHGYLRAGAAGGGEDWLLRGHAERDGGWRDASGYEQAKANGAWRTGDWTLRGAATWLRQDTAGFIFGEDAYESESARESNPVPGAFRDADSQRVSASWRPAPASGRGLEADGWARHSWMEFTQHFLPGRPVEENAQASAGGRLLLRSGDDAVSTVLGAEAEWMDAWLTETQAGPVEDGPASLRETRPPGKHYDFEVEALMTGLFAQHERDLAPGWRLTAGLRWERLAYDYDNRMLDGNTRDDGTPCGLGGCLFFRPADRDDDFHGLAPKLGLVWAAADDLALYAHLARGFRFPQATELYRLQRQQDIGDIEPVVLDSLELGLRRSGPRVRAELAAFRMEKRDDIFRDAEGLNVSDGETRHVGLEYSIEWRLAAAWSLGASGTWARHTYRFDRAVGGGETVSSGDDVDTAPRQLHDLRLRWSPRASAWAELEWLRVGSYWMDAANTEKYGGHALLNLRLGHAPAPDWRWTLRVTNLLDADYAERADFAFGEFRYFPGRGRAAFLELAWTP